MNYQLTLDSELQWAAERRLAAGPQADQGRLRVRDRDGHQDRPAAGPGQRAGLRPQPAHEASDEENRGNRAVSAPYEPGSVQKVLTAAALIDSGDGHAGDQGGGAGAAACPATAPSRTPSTTRRRSSSSTCAASSPARPTSAPSCWPGRWTSTSCGTTCSASGSAARPASSCRGSPAASCRRPTSRTAQRDQVAFGQALAVTGMQEAAALAGILNGGVYNPPTVIQGVTDAEGRDGAGRPAGAPPGGVRRDLGPGPGPDGGGGRQRERPAGPQAGRLPQRRQDRHRAAGRHHVRLLPRLRHLLRGVRPGGRPADPDLRRGHQPEGRRHGHRDGGPGGPGPDERGAAALLGRRRTRSRTTPSPPNGSEPGGRRPGPGRCTR